MPKEQWVTRADRAELVRMEAPERTAEGYLKVWARTARVGVLDYLLADGTYRREFVPPETLFAPQSLQSMEGKPMTPEHPARRLSPTNQDDNVGTCLTAGERTDGGWVKNRLILHDADAIAAAESGQAVEMSWVYDTRIVPTPGVYVDDAGNRHPYDVVQVGRYHKELAQTERARAGGGARMRLDSLGVDAVALSPDEDRTMKDNRPALMMLLSGLGLGITHTDSDDSVIAKIKDTKERADGIPSEDQILADRLAFAGKRARLMGHADSLEIDTTKITNLDSLDNDALAKALAVAHDSTTPTDEGAGYYRARLDSAVAMKAASTGSGQQFNVGGPNQGGAGAGTTGVRTDSPNTDGQPAPRTGYPLELRTDSHGSTSDAYRSSIGKPAGA